MISYGDREYVPQLKRLWKECFDDEDAYIDAFFDALYLREHVLMEEENGMLMGASFFLPGKIYLEYPGTEGYWQDIRYVYALAVWPQYRGRGIAGELLKNAHRIYQAPLIAEPAEEGLVGGFYEPLGFSKEFYLKKHLTELPQYDLQAAQISSGMEVFQGTRLPAALQEDQTVQQLFALREDQTVQQPSALQEDQTAVQQPSVRQVYPADAKTYCRIRDRLFRKHGYVSWPQKHVAFAIAQHCENGGDALVVSGNGREDILLYYVENGQAVVTETTLGVQEAVQVLYASLQKPCGTVLLKREADWTGEAGMKGQEIPCRDGWQLTGVSFGMPPGVRGYLNITLD